MNTIVGHQKVFRLLSLTALVVLGASLPAVAQTADTVSTQELTQLSPAATTPNSVEKFKSASAPEQFPAIAAGASSEAGSAFAPSVSTSQTTVSNKVAQADIGIGRPTRGGSSYIGVGANIGLSGGDSALGDGNFTILSKIGFTRALSVRPSVILGDNTTILIPVSYDFSFQQLGDLSEPLPVAPYIGAGAAIKTGDDSQAAFLISGGVDIPLNSQFTATAAVNAAFFDRTDVGLLIGVGYNFRGIGL